MTKPIRQASAVPMILAATLLMMGVAVSGLGQVPADWRWLALGLMAASTLLYARSPGDETPAWQAHGYFVAQTILFGTLLALAPTGRAQFSLPFFILCSQALMLFPLRTGLVWIGIFGLVTGVDFVLVSGFSTGLIELFPFLSGYFFFGAISYLWAQTDVARRESQRLLTELQAAHAQLQRYAARVEELTIAEERNRIAREIHDTLGHTLTALDIQLELLVRLPSEKTAERQQATERARQLVKQGLADARRAVQALRPVALEVFSLPEAMVELVEEFKRTTAIESAWEVEGRAAALPPRLALPLYRAAQESLTNIQRHAATTPRVALRLCYEPERVRLRVQNAPPVSPAAGASRAGSGYGLRGLRERVEALGGTFHAGADDSGGFAVEMTLPL